MVSDQENPEWTEADFAKAKGPEDLPPELAAAFPQTKAKRGRPAGSTTSNLTQVTLRIDKDVVAKFKSGGPGWHGRMHEALRKAAGL